jgi:small redox-active disulfide protein 2
MLNIKILGSGCENCKRLAWLTERAAQHLGIEVQIVKVTEYPDIMAYNVMSTPGLVINEKVVSAGRVPSEAEITKLLTTALESA